MTRPVLRTALCDRLGIEYPVLLAGMGPVIGEESLGVAGPELAAAVSNAGGLGILGAAALPPDELEAAIKRIRELTDRPFGVDILLPGGTGARGLELPKDLRTLLPAEQKEGIQHIRERLGLPEARADLSSLGLPRFSSQDQVDVVTGMRAAVLATGLGDPGPYVEQVHAAGGLVISLVGNVKGARRVAASGADFVVAQGHEAGGHTGRIGTMALLPQVIDAVAPTPVIAAGGIGDGRGLAAALAMGCVGAWCGTVFIPTLEANLDDFKKERILAATEEGTRVTRLYSGKTMRNVTNELIEAWEASGIPPLPMGLQMVLISDVLESVKTAGREELMMNAAGQISGLLHELRSAAEVLDSMVAEAVEILTERLPATVKAERG